VTEEDVVDFTGGYSAEQWSPIWAEAYCNWRQLALYDPVHDPDQLLPRNADPWRLPP